MQEAANGVLEKRKWYCKAESGKEEHLGGGVLIIRTQ